MADKLGAPLGGKKGKSVPGTGFWGRSRLPLARIGLAIIALISIGLALRIVLVDAPQGGRPVAEAQITSTLGANSVAGDVAQPEAAVPEASITAEPETAIPAPGGASIVTVDNAIPDGNTTPQDIAEINDKGVVIDLIEKIEQGSIPRLGTDGQTPFATYSRPSVTPETAPGKTLIAIVVTGLGLSEGSTIEAVSKLPEAVTLAFAPYGTTLDRTVGAARAAGHELLLQVPLEPFDYPENDPGPDTLLTGQPPRDNIAKLFTVMAKFGGYVGLINHMGARFTASSIDFAPMMEELGARGLGYLDDGSSNRSVAPQLAAANKVPFARADMELDTNPARGPILEALAALEAKAVKAGSAIGVISGLPVSIQTVAEWAKGLEGKNIILVPVSALMKIP